MEDKIKVGEYIRTFFGRIGKVIEITNDYIFTDTEANCIALQDCNHFFRDTFNQVVKKHSPNIIDLIEKGDYVNGKLIHKVDIRENSAYIYYGNSKTFTNYQIKSIVTKEQFEKAKYTVDKEENK